MSPPPVRGGLPLGGAYDPRPKETLRLSGPRDLLVRRSTPAAFGVDGEVARDTLHAILESAFTGPVPAGPSIDDVVRVEERPVIWGGNVIPHYGHFMTESVGRLWPLLPRGELEGVPVVLTAPRESPPAFVDDWLLAFGAELVQIPERGALRCTRMHVPEPALRHGAWIAPEIREIHLQARRGMGAEPAPSRDLVWLSRAQLRRDRKAYDERFFEWLLDDRVDRVRPERMALADQVAALEGARAVAGVIGSAFHTLLMVENVPDSLYLCPPFDREAFPAQHRIMDGTATFTQALAVTSRQRRAREGVSFPGCFRLLIPEALRALSETVLPGLLDDPRLASFADPGAARPERAETELDAAALRALREPLAPEPRRRLAELFEAAGLERCAEEQRELVDDLERE